MFKPLYYLGCKHAYADTIVDAINELDPVRGRACDLFAGTGAIGMALRAHRAVTTVDVQEYSRVLCSAQLSPARLEVGDVQRILAQILESPLFETLQFVLEPVIAFEDDALERLRDGDMSAIVSLLERPPLAFSSGIQGKPDCLDEARALASDRLSKAGLASDAGSTITRLYGGLYFSSRQSVFLDAAVAHAKRQHEFTADTLVAAALSTAGTMVNTIGKQFAQPIRPRHKSGEVKASVSAAILRDRTIDATDTYAAWLGRYGSMEPSRYEHRAVRMDYLEGIATLGDEFSVVYADPPYTRDHYSRFYHVLETLCLHDSPEVVQVTRSGTRVPSRGIYRTNRHQSPFSIRSAAPAAFDALFAATRSRGLPVLLSYSPHEDNDGTHPRVVSSKDLVAIARRHYPKADSVMLENATHNKLNRNSLALRTRPHAEMLIRCVP